VRTTARHPNPAGLKDALADGVRKFEAQARAQGLPNEQVVAGRYILCTFLDEWRRQHAVGRCGRVVCAEPAGPVPQRDRGAARRSTS
jgi:type VI protein secretion system component VasF